MSAFTYHDNSEALSPRVVDESGSVLIDFAGDWFESGECELFVDGIAVGSSSGSLSSYLLLGAGNSWKSYFVTLKLFTVLKVLKWDPLQYTFPNSTGKGNCYVVFRSC